MEQIVEKLVLFNNTTLNRAQWDYILKSAGAPKNQFFWKALRDNCLFKNPGNTYTLQSLNSETFNKVWDEYCVNNRKSVKKVYDKKKAKKEFEEKKRKALAAAASITPKNFRVVNGVVMVFNDPYDFK